MKLAYVLVGLFLALPAGADEIDPFQNCERGTNESMVQSCRLAIIDDYIKTEFGARALTKATKLADTKCSDVSSKLDHSLRRLVSLNCKFNFKLEHYNQLADAANVEIEAENAEAQASK